MKTVFTLVRLIFILPRLLWAHGLDCNIDPLDFEEGISQHWITNDLLGGGNTWASISECQEAANYTGGTGEGACLSGITTSSSAVDATIETFDFFLGCMAQAELSFDLNLQLSSANAELILEASTDLGATWLPFVAWSQNVGQFRNAVGEVVSIDLSSLSTDGFGETLLRWRYRDLSVTSTDWYVQIDNISLSCVESERADIAVRVYGDRGPVIEGTVLTYQIEARNLGPNIANDVDLITTISGISTSKSEFSYNLNSLNPGETILSSFELELKNQFPSSPEESTVVAYLDSRIFSSTCDIRLINNKYLFDTTVDLDSDFDGLINDFDSCPTNPLVSSGSDCSLTPSELLKISLKQSKKLLAKLVNKGKKENLVMKLLVLSDQVSNILLGYSNTIQTKSIIKLSKSTKKTTKQIGKLSTSTGKKFEKHVKQALKNAKKSLNNL